MNDDIRPIIDSWPYRSGKISVRKIIGDDGQPKIQMRLDLGVLQMEPTGRPDGQKPHGFDTVYDYYCNKIEEYKASHHTDIAFELTTEDCNQLRDEALMYYHRYLACFILEDYEQVIYDTQRNMLIFDLCKKYAARKSDRLALEQHRPYVIMMNTRAKAHLASKIKEYPLAIQHIKAGLKAIRNLYDDVDQREDYPFSPEVAMLKQLARKFRRKLPADPLRILEKKLQRAVKNEQFEEAADLRDQIGKFRDSQMENQPPEKPNDNKDEDDVQ